MSSASDFNSDLAFFDNVIKARQKAADKARKEQAKRDAYLFDETKVARDIASRTQSLLPENARVKAPKAGGSKGYAEVDAAFNESNPVAGIGQEVMDITRSLRGKKLRGSPKGEELVDRVYSKVLQRKLPEAYKYKLKQDTSIFGKEVGELPGYEQYKEGWEQTEGQPDRSEYVRGLTPKGIATNLGILAGGNVLLEGIGRVGKRMGWRTVAKAAGRGLFSLPPAGAPGVAAKVAGLALMGAADFAMFDAAAGLVSESKWAKAREDEPIKTTLAELVAGGGASAAMAPRLARSLKTLSQDRTVNKAAGEILNRTGKVSDLMEYNKSLKVLNKSKKTTLEEARKFAEKNTSKRSVSAREVEEFKLNAYAPNTANKSYGVFTRGLEQSRAWKEAEEATRKYGDEITLPADRRKALIVRPSTELKPTGTEKAWGYEVVTPELSWNPRLKVSTNTPLLASDRSHLLLPAPIEKTYGAGMPHRQRVAMRAFYESNPGARKAVIELGDNHRVISDEERLTAIHNYMAANPGAKTIPKNLFGDPVEYAGVTQKVNKALSASVYESSSVGKALSYGLEGKSWRQTFRNLDQAGLNEVADLAELGIPPQVSVSLAGMKNAARSARSTVLKEGKRDAAISKAIDRDVKTGKFKSSGIVHRAKGEGLDDTATERLLSEGAEVTIPKTKKVKESVTGKKVGDQVGKLSPEQLKKFRKAKLAREKAKQTSMGVKPPAKEVELLPEDGELLTSYLDDIDIGNLVKKGLLLVPLTSVGLIAADVNEADASVLGKVSALAVDLAAKGAKKVSSEELIKTLNKSSFVGVKGNKLGKVERWQDGVQLNPTIESIKSISTKAPKFLRDLVMTPGAVARFFYHEAKNPVVELSTRITAAHSNTQMHTQAVKEILSLVPGYKNASREVRKAMKPLVDKYQEPLAKVAYHKGMVDDIEKQIKKVSKKKDAEGFEVLSKQLEDSKLAYQDAKKGLKEYSGEWTATVQELAKKHSGTRIALALEDTADFKYYPWLKGMLKADEKTAVSMLKDLNKTTQGRIEAVGGNVIKSRPFAHHAIHPDTNYKAIKKSFEGTTVNVNDALNLARLNSRSIGSKMMMPDIEYMFERYIPDVERRIQIMDFWKKGKPGGWDAHQKDLIKHNMMTEDLKSFWKNINDSFVPPMQTKPAEWARRYYALEVARLLFLSPSVGFKHAMKLTADMAIFPLDVWAKGVTQAPKILMDIKVAELNQKWPEFAKTIGVSNWKMSEKAQLVRAYINQGRYHSAIADLDYRDAPVTAFDRVLDKFNQTGSVIVGTVENFDRAATVLMGMEMAAKKGMTPSQATHAVFDTILKANFLSGVHNPKWLRDPHARAFFMFQGTPFKIAEQRLMRAATAGKDVLSAGKVTLEELKDFKSFMKQGEMKVKMGMITDALTASKDPFGTSVTKQFMVNLLTLGGVIGAGDYLFDADLHTQVVHPPFVKPGDSAVSVTMNPIVSAGYEAMAKRHEEDRDLLFVEFWNKWLGSPGEMVLTFRKALRLSNDDIPEIYRGDKWKYFLGVPYKENH